MTDYEKIKATLESPGMKLIAKGLKAHHKAVYAKYRTCGSMEELLNLQTVQKVIDTTLPQILNSLMNKHIEMKPPQKSPEWWEFGEWIKRMLK